MSDTATKGESTARVTELNVSGHLMTLDSGLFCILQMPSKAADAAIGMPGVRLSVPPGTASRPDAIHISTFRNDGWLAGTGDAALVRVTDGPAQVLVTVYQAPTGADTAPKLQVLRLLDGAAPRPVAPVAAAVPPQAEAQASEGVAHGQELHKPMDMIAHVQGRGDVGTMLGEWLGDRGSKRWIEGFAVAPSHDVPAADVEYQAVLGRGWLSPWAEGGQFCGSRGMALPVLGLRLRLRGASAEAYEVTYSATFTDGTEIGPVAAGEACEAESLAPMEAFRIDLRARSGQPAATPAATDARPARAKARPAAKPAAKPAKPAKPGPGRRR